LPRSETGAFVKTSNSRSCVWIALPAADSDVTPAAAHLQGQVDLPRVLAGFKYFVSTQIRRWSPDLSGRVGV